MRTCPRCEIEQPETEYDQYRKVCKSCRRAEQRARYERRLAEDPTFRERLTRKYRERARFYRQRDTWARIGVTFNQREQMAADQNGECAICHRVPGPDERMLGVDHDHETGRVRGLLCNPCNLILGHARDDVTVLQAAIDYLNSHKGDQ